MIRICSDVSELTLTAQKACREFLAECERQGLSVKITETYRSQKRQNELYAQGRTAPGKIVTWTKKSRHTCRRAWDIVKKLPGGGVDYSDIRFFKKCGEIAAKLGITWGGEWKTPDMPHFEVGDGWQMIKEDGMTDNERRELELLAKKIDKIVKEMPKVYHYTEAVPEWGRATVQKLLDKGFLSGIADDNLDLPEPALRLLVINDRAGLYDL